MWKKSDTFKPASCNEKSKIEMDVFKATCSLDRRLSTFSIDILPEVLTFSSYCEFVSVSGLFPDPFKDAIAKQHFNKLTLHRDFKKNC